MRKHDSVLAIGMLQNDIFLARSNYFMCRDIQSVVLITQVVRQNAMELIESGTAIIDIMPTLNILYPGDMNEILPVIFHFKAQMLDILTEEQMEGIYFLSADDIKIIGVGCPHSNSLDIATLKLSCIGYDADLGHFSLIRDKRDNVHPIRSQIKESNKKLSKSKSRK